MTPGDDLGQRPHPNAKPCGDCGHMWFEGERRHHYVDERGQDSIDDDADVVCTLCKRQRHHPRTSEEKFDWGER